MSTTIITLESDEIGCILTALDWYVDDRNECARAEARNGFNGDDHLIAAQKALALFQKLNTHT